MAFVIDHIYAKDDAFKEKYKIWTLTKNMIGQIEERVSPQTKTGALKWKKVVNKIGKIELSLLPLSFEIFLRFSKSHLRFFLF